MVTTPKPAAVAPKATPSPSELSPLELHGLLIAAKPAGKWRDQLTPGAAQVVDFVVRIRGTVDVGDEQTAVVIKKPPAEAVLAHALEALGPANQNRIFEHLTQLSDLAELPEPGDKAVTLARQLIETLAKQETQTKRGNVTGAITVERRKR